MKRRRRREHEIFSLSFLDAISGGFGAIVMLLVIVKVAEPTVIKDRGVGLESTAITLARELPELEQQIKSQQQQLADAQKLLALVQRDVSRLAPGAAAARKQREASALNARAATTIEQRLAIARQELTAEMLRLQAVRPATAASELVGGIPVDSEYIIFVIDTSGSMQSIWPKVVRTLDMVLNAYPKVKGIQVMSDMGEYMYSQYAGQWIPDTPGRRRAVLQRMASWAPFSNSSPAEGVTAALQSFNDPSKHISIYVFFDDFTGPSIQTVVDAIASINRRGRDGKPLVRIHAIGFPDLFSMPGAGSRAIGAATLMHALTNENGGTFVGLPSTR